MLRTSTATHLVWAPPRWLPAARRTLAGLAERHPSRVVFLVPEPGRRDAVESSAAIREFELDEGREVFSEVIELRLRGTPARHPGSIVLPLLIADLPAFCRWRGEPDWGSSALEEIVEVCDRLIVDSAEWRGVPAAYALGSRLRREIRLTRRPAPALAGVAVDGDALKPPSSPPAESADLLSAELDVLVRDPVYEAAVAAVLA